MIFIFWGVFITLGLGINELKYKIIDFERRNNTIDGITYTDHNSRKRLLSNNHPCITRYSHGDCEIIDCNTMEIIWTTADRRISQNIEKYKNDAIKNKRTTFRCDTHNDKMHYYEYGEIKGHIYEDFKTHRKYVIRKSFLDDCYLFIDIETKQAVRYTDYTINYINNRIKNIRDEIEKNNTTINYWKLELDNWERIKEGSKIVEWNKMHNNNCNIGKDEYIGENKEEEFCNNN